MEDLQNEVIVSVCCLTFNHSKFITACLDGILMQQCSFKFEILIHDDASTDGTREIVEAYQKKYPEIIKPYFQTENQWSKGVRGMNFHFNFSRAKGKFIAVCEGDDFWTDPLKLQTQVMFLIDNPAYAMIFHNADLLIDNKIEINQSFSKIENRDYSQIEVFKNWIVPTASMCFKKEVIEDSNYVAMHSEKDLIYGDNILLVTSAHIGKLRGISDIMSIYRKHSAGVSYTVDRKVVEALNRQNTLFAKYFPNLADTAKDLIRERYYTHLKIAMKSVNITNFFYFLFQYLRIKFFTSWN